MVKVVERGRYSVYVFDEARSPHHLPHCHVRWAGSSASVALWDFQVLGGVLPASALGLLEDHADEIRAVWNRLNPGRPIE